MKDIEEMKKDSFCICGLAHMNYHYRCYRKWFIPHPILSEGVFSHVVYKDMVLPPSCLVGIRKGQTMEELKREIKEAYEMAGEEYTP